MWTDDYPGLRLGPYSSHYRSRRPQIDPRTSRQTRQTPFGEGSSRAEASCQRYSTGTAIVLRPLCHRSTVYSIHNASVRILTIKGVATIIHGWMDADLLNVMTIVLHTVLNRSNNKNNRHAM